MARYKANKLNYLIRHAPNGKVLTSKWLKNQGVDHKLAWWYVRSGWLEHLGNKAYKRAGDKVNWPGAIAALQQQLKLPIHIGGKTALQLLGKAHYVPLSGISVVELFTLASTTIPQWLTKASAWGVEVHIHKTILFNIQSQKLPGLTIEEIQGIMLQISTPERA